MLATAMRDRATPDAKPRRRACRRQDHPPYEPVSLKPIAEEKKEATK